MSVNLLTLASSSALNISSSSSHPTPSIAMPDKVWYFTADQLANSPSRRHGIDVDQELSYRQMTAYLIQEMGQRLQVSQLCINTAIVYMHRFYAFHSFTHFHRNGIAAASLFLAAKVEEQPRKLEHVIKAANKCLNQPTSSTTDAYYLEQAQDLVFNENVLLQTLGFDVAIDHPHTHVVKTCHLVKACKDLAQTSYFLASNSLHLTSMCLQYRPTVVACFCIYLACKWSRWEIPQSTEGKHWFHYVDKTVTMDLLKQLTDEFIAIYEKSPARLKSKLNSIKALAQGASNRVVNSKDKKATPEEWKMVDMMKMYHSSINTNEPNNASATSNSFPTIAEQQHQSSQGGQASLLPPPSQHAHQQQIRRPESHSSQHRSHHSSSASHHHSSKQAFATNDATDHKATSSHKQPHYNSSASSRSRDYSQSSQNLNALSIMPPSASNAAGGSRSSLSAANSNNSGRPSMPSGVASQKLTSSQAHDASFHKSTRDRSSLPAALNAASVLSAQPHKQLTQKPDPGRLALKEHLGRGIAEQQSKPSNSKMFVPANGPQAGQANQLQSGAEMSRNAIQQQLQQRIPPPPGYHQSTMSRSSTNNNKHDQSVSSVQMQSQQPQQHKQIASLLENQFGAVSAEQMQSQPLHTAAASLSYADSRTAAADARHNSGSDQMETDLSQTYSPFLPMHAFKYQQSQQPQGQGQGQTKVSMFSPEWNEKMPQQLSAGGSNMKPSTTPASLNYIKAANSFDSPKKIERERSLGTPTKKERNRLSYTGIDVSARPNSQSQKMQMQKKLDTVDNNSNVLAGTSAGAYSSSVKRPNESAQIKMEDDLIRDTKIRKLEPPSSSMTQSYADTRSAIDTTSKLQVVNGIETNPDLVRNLLKESLCTTNALIKSEPPSTSIFHPASHQQSHESANMLLKEEKHVNPALDNDESVSGKSEKKKKKDKHKHKEKDKDKSKDREERKKHKKDKDRHKERGESDRDSEPVKIKISKEKLETSANISGEPLGFKIKIPKERITGDLNSGAGNAINYGNIAADNSSTSSSCAPPALKIKISKDKLENYSSGSSDSAANTAAFNNLHNQNVASSNNPHSGNVLFSSSSGSGSGSSSNNKKKDRERDREREKEKKRNSFEYMKANANGSGTTTIGGGGTSSLIQSSTSSSKSSSSSSKIQHYNNNTLSQLFGESNDDDDDDDDKTYQRPKKTSLLKTAVGSASSYSSATQNYTFSSKPNTEMGGNSDGVLNLQQQQQQHHHHHQQQYHPHQSLTNPQRQIYQKK